MSVKELYESGDLTGAIEAQTQLVKAQPADTARRTFLFELLSFAGELERAQKQLEVIAHQDPQSDWPCQVYGNVLHAEGQRRRLFSEGLKPEFLLDPPQWVGWHLDALNRLREGRADEACELLSRSELARGELAGLLDGQPFEEFRDFDDLVAPILELFILRDYIWLPYSQIRELELSVPERPRDLLWVPARIELSDGSQRRGYVPALYHGTHQHGTDHLKLGRGTDWTGPEGGPVQGLGQRMFLAGDLDKAMLELRSVRFGG